MKDSRQQRDYLLFFVFAIVCICIGRFSQKVLALTPDEVIETAIDYMTHPWTCSAAKFLFSVDLKFQSDLDNDIVSEDLRQEFENNGISLSDNITVSIEEKGSRWLIIDKNKVYPVRKEESKLNIYDTNIHHGWDSAVEEPKKWIDTPDKDTSEGQKLRGWFRVNEVNIGIPYKWGGFNTISEFDEGIRQGKYAGDICCIKPGTDPPKLYPSGSDDAVGVDCSGFVCRCWGLSQPYRTSQLLKTGIQQEIGLQRLAKLLFRVDLKFQSDLDSNDISKEFQQEFEDHNISLSDNVTVSVEEKENRSPGEKKSRWLIVDIDNKETYIVTKEVDRLNIYLPKFSDIKKGDILLTRGHVMLCLEHNSNGTITAVTVYEASYHDWRVNQRTHKISDLKKEKYTPYRYKEIQPTSPSTKFNPGDYVQTADNLNMREGPGTGYAEVPLPNGYIPKGSKIQIIDNDNNGVFVDGYYWWHVRFESDNGWCAEDWLEKTEPPTETEVSGPIVGEVLATHLETSAKWKNVESPVIIKTTDTAEPITLEFIIDWEYGENGDEDYNEWNIKIEYYEKQDGEWQSIDVVRGHFTDVPMFLDHDSGTRTDYIKVPPIAGVYEYKVKLQAQYWSGGWFFGGLSLIAEAKAELEIKVIVTSGDASSQAILSITSAEALSGANITVQVSITDATGLAAGDILVKYDASVITVGEVKGTDLISGINLLVNKDVLGEITLSMAGTQGIPSGSGAIIDIELTVNADAKVGTETTLEFGDTEIYDESGAVIPINLENGVVKITQQGIKGDVNNDGKIRSNDALLVLRIAAGLMTPSDYQKWAADMNDDGKIKANDALLILRKAAGLAAPDIQPVAAIGRTITVMLGESHGVAGESITVLLRVDNIDGLAGGDICIVYDSKVLRAVEVANKHDLVLASNIAESGVVQIAFATADRLSNKNVAKIQFDILADDVSPLTIENVELYRSDVLPFDSQKIDGRFSSWAIPPEHSALLQNFPNPFNPDTWIPYQLANDSSVVISIYNVRGQVIRTISLDTKQAGVHITKGRAAYWDGRNETDENVSSGVYFYHLQAGSFRATKKMVIAK
ncbi:MAG: T9SS type A sorting domain-containing protein [Deltaproteobacteria bacterium]|nr:T9SS type A sorting domain-containing protein [Deltaproteobacteria bacterium]